MIDFSDLRAGKEYIITYKSSYSEREYRLRGVFVTRETILSFVDLELSDCVEMPVASYPLKRSSDSSVPTFFDEYYKFKLDDGSYSAVPGELIIDIEETNKSKSLVRNELYD